MAQTTNKVMAVIEKLFQEMRKHHEKTEVEKEGFIPSKRRARNASMELTHALKEYRSVSNKESGLGQNANGKKIS